MNAARPLRVVQWASGALGRSVLRGLLERPGFEVAGVRVYDPAKIGMDAGILASRPPVGIAATADEAEILALDADCVVYAPLPGSVHGNDDLKTVCALLASGKNVIAMSGFVYPRAHGPEFADALERACAEGGTSIHGTGVSPGFMGEKLPLVMSGLCRKVDHLYVRECFDVAGHPSRGFVNDMLRFGHTEEKYVEALPCARAVMRATFADSLHLLAAGLNVVLDEIDLDHEHVLAPGDLPIAAGLIPRGTVAAARWTFTGRVDGQPFITLETVHKADASRIRDWHDPGYGLRIQGLPSLSLTAADDWISNAISAAAAHALNSIVPVCEAAPGIRTLLDLPLITGRLSR
ncbi:dihydrodipicolinate reductase [Actinocorallia longicatena]|uniref:Diacylglycerol kinase n=1 Tax=Actinocorallia longicatena TaxID=111803 RepID=A0ABP6Q054_9ACTN